MCASQYWFILCNCATKSALHMWFHQCMVSVNTTFWHLQRKAVMASELRQILIPRPARNQTTDKFVWQQLPFNWIFAFSSNQVDFAQAQNAPHFAVNLAVVISACQNGLVENKNAKVEKDANSVLELYTAERKRPTCTNLLLAGLRRVKLKLLNKGEEQSLQALYSDGA